MTPANHRHTILVVDDEPDVVRSVKDLLRLDYKVLTATNGEEGCRLMREHPVDVVMTDQRMPEMTGVQFLSKIKGPHPEATRLLFTGYADIRAVIEAINQGNVYRYITKPWDPDELQTIIHEACERHDLIVQKRELMDLLEEKNGELLKANNELREASELKSAFIQVASHELRTPLAILTGYTELAVRAGGAAEPLSDWLDAIHRSGEQLRRLVNQMTSVLEDGDFRASLQRQPTDVSALITDAVADVEPFLGLRHQTLRRDWPADLGTMEIDPNKIRDCLNHLLLNAIKFTPDDGTITVSANRDATQAIQISVADTGAGLDEANLKRFGEPFFTGFDVAHHSSGTYEHGRRGIGLGVTVVKKFVEMHGGRLSVASEVGKGTTVTITLPNA